MSHHSFWCSCLPPLNLYSCLLIYIHRGQHLPDGQSIEMKFRSHSFPTHQAVTSLCVSVHFQMRNQGLLPLLTSSSTKVKPLDYILINTNFRTSLFLSILLIPFRIKHVWIAVRFQSKREPPARLLVNLARKALNCFQLQHWKSQWKFRYWFFFGIGDLFKWRSLYFMSVLKFFKFYGCDLS